MMKRFKLWQRITVASIAISMLAILLSMGVVYVQYGKSIEYYTYVQQQQTVVRLAEYYNEKLSKILNLAHSVMESPSFTTSLQSVMWSDNYSYGKELSIMQASFQNIIQKDRVIHSCYLYTPKGQFYNATNHPIAGFDFTKSELYAHISEAKNIYWGPVGISEIFDKNYRIIPVVMSVPFSQEGNKIFMVVNLSEKELVAPLLDAGQISPAYVYICDENGEIITSSGDYYDSMFSDADFIENIKNEKQFQYDHANGALFANSAGITINDWYVVIIQTERDLFSNLRQLQLYTFIIAGVGLLLTSLSSYAVAKTVTRPVYRLRDTMSVVEGGDLKVRFTPDGDGEVEQLGIAFNNMLDEIEQLINDLHDEKEKTLVESKKKRNAELRALQEQINPHLLYNTLDSLYWKSKMADNEAVSEMIIALSNLFRISLSKGAEEIPISMEIEHVRLYLYLQSCIYPGKFTYSVSVSDDILDCMCLKLLLQPVVENCIVHAAKSSGSIEIKVTATMDDSGKIHYIVSDTGRGFDAAALNRSVVEAPSPDRGGYALKNIYTRLALAYNGAGGIVFLNGVDGENIVEVFFPAKEAEQ